MSWSRNPIKRRAAKKAKKLRLKLRAHAKLGGKCARCGYSETHLALEVDHIHGTENGQRIRQRRTGHTLHSHILNGRIPLEEVQLLCANCHRIKTYENQDFLNHIKPIGVDLTRWQPGNENQTWLF